MRSLPLCSTGQSHGHLRFRDEEIGHGLHFLVEGAAEYGGHFFQSTTHGFWVSWELEVGRKDALWQSGWPKRTIGQVPEADAQRRSLWSLVWLSLYLRSPEAPCCQCPRGYSVNQDDYVDSIEARAINQKISWFMFSEKHGPQANSIFVISFTRSFSPCGLTMGKTVIRECVRAWKQSQRSWIMEMVNGFRL